MPTKITGIVTRMDVGGYKPIVLAETANRWFLLRQANAPVFTYRLFENSVGSRVTITGEQDQFQLTVNGPKDIQYLAPEA